MMRSCCSMTFAAALAATLGVVGWTARACAQGQSIPTYRPATPTLSPWLNLYQSNTGPLDSYHTYVRPQMRLQDTLKRQDASIRSLDQYVTSQPQQQETPGVATTGTGAGFMSYSHYYPLMTSSTRAPIGNNLRRPTTTTLQVNRRVSPVSTGYTNTSP